MFCSGDEYKIHQQTKNTLSLAELMNTQIESVYVRWLTISSFDNKCTDGINIVDQSIRSVLCIAKLYILDGIDTESVRLLIIRIVRTLSLNEIKTKIPIHTWQHQGKYLAQ